MTARRRDGSTFIAQSRTRTLPGGDGSFRVTAIHDVTLQKRVEARLRHDALHDPLTGLKNRAASVDAVRQAVFRADRHRDYGFAVLFVDLDRFESVNDRFGHAAGDALLAAIGGRIQASVREVDVAARLGGDEFVVLLDDVRDEATAYDLASRLHVAPSAPFQLDGRPHRVDCCIGVGLERGDRRGPEHRESQQHDPQQHDPQPRDPLGRDPERLIREADTAMYRAKARGKGQVVLFDDEPYFEAPGHALVDD